MQTPLRSRFAYFRHPSRAAEREGGEGLGQNVQGTSVKFPSVCAPVRFPCEMADLRSAPVLSRRSEYSRSVVSLNAKGLGKLSNMSASSCPARRSRPRRTPSILAWIVLLLYSVSVNSLDHLFAGLMIHSSSKASCITGWRSNISWRMRYLMHCPRKSPYSAIRYVSSWY